MAIGCGKIRLAVFAAGCPDHNRLETKGAFLELLGYRHEPTMMESAPNINQKESSSTKSSDTCRLGEWPESTLHNRVGRELYGGEPFQVDVMEQAVSGAAFFEKFNVT